MNLTITKQGILRFFIGGDSDTIAAMTGSVAEAFYGIDEELKKAALSYLDPTLLEIATQFEKTVMKKEN